MQKFILAYHGSPEIQTKEEGAAHMARWQEWSQGLGDSVVDPGMPVGPSMTISESEVVEGGGSNPLSGITIIQAESMEDAITMAKDCPHLSGTGTIEIAPAMEM